MRYEQRLIWVLGITFGFLFFDRNAASFLMPFIAADLHFSNQQIGLIASALSFTWAVSAFLGGALSDHTGSRKPILLVSTVTFSLCSFLSGLAGSFLALFAARLLMGLVEGPFMPVCQSLLAAESDPARRGHNMGVMQNFGSRCRLLLRLVHVARDQYRHEESRDAGEKERHAPARALGDGDQHQRCGE